MFNVVSGGGGALPEPQRGPSHSLEGVQPPELRLGHVFENCGHLASVNRIYIGKKNAKSAHIYI
jgi:hypothetical protein